MMRLPLSKSVATLVASVPLLSLPLLSVEAQTALFDKSWAESMAEGYAEIRLQASRFQRDQSVDALTESTVEAANLGSENFWKANHQALARAQARFSDSYACLGQVGREKLAEFDFGDDFDGAHLGIRGKINRTFAGGGCSYRYGMPTGSLTAGGYYEANWVGSDYKFESAPTQISEREDTGFGSRQGTMVGYKANDIDFLAYASYTTGLTAELEGTLAFANNGVSVGSASTQLITPILPPMAEVGAVLPATESVDIYAKLEARFWNAVDAPQSNPTSTGATPPFYETAPDKTELNITLGTNIQVTEKLDVSARVGLSTGATGSADNTLVLPATGVIRAGVGAEYALNENLFFGGSVEIARGRKSDQDDGSTAIEYSNFGDFSGAAFAGYRF